MDACQSFVADTQPAELVQPCNAALHDLARLAQTAAVCHAMLGQIAGDAPHFEFVTMRLGVVATVALDTARLSLGPSRLAGNRWDRIDQRQQPGMSLRLAWGRITLSGRPPASTRRRCLLLALRDRLGSVRFSPRARRVPMNCPRPHATDPACRRYATATAGTWWSRAQARACCHSRNRRQYVMPEPQPISCGSISQGMPVCRTNRMPVKARRSSSRLRPGYREQRGLTGSSASIKAHTSSSTSGSAIGPPQSQQVTRYSDS